MQPDLTLKGVPPQSSSCGGRGPFTAEVWARRKGYDDIANMIRTAAAATEEFEGAAPDADAGAAAEIVDAAQFTLITAQ